MKNIVVGGLCLKDEDSKIFFTDSGRSSLRLFLRNIDKNKKILIPNFLCEVIVKILEEENIKYEFYNILNDLSIDKTTVVNKVFDIFYVINYFGMLLDTSKIKLDDKIVVEDNVFLYDFYNINNYKNWFAFNSFRKSKNGKRIEHKRARQQIKFYDGFEQFIEENRKRNNCE